MSKTHRLLIGAAVTAASLTPAASAFALARQQPQRAPSCSTPELPALPSTRSSADGSLLRRQPPLTAIERTREER